MHTFLSSGGDLHVTYTSGEIISGSYAFRQSNLTIVAVGLHYDNTTLQCCTTDLVQCSQVLTLHVVGEYYKKNQCMSTFRPELNTEQNSA